MSNAIVEGAMATRPKMKEYKASSLGNENVHHQNVESNIVIEHTSARKQKKRQLIILD